LKIQLLSDLHNEFLRKGKNTPEHRWSGSIPDTDADLVVLAGDIDTGTHGVEWAITESRRLAKKIIYVPGNHEFYGHEYHAMKSEISRLCDGTDVYCLDPGMTIHQGVRFIGATLWTNYEADSSVSPEMSMDYIDGALADHWRIKFIQDDSSRRFMPQDALALHVKQLGWLEQQLNSPHDGRTVVVTHHGPHPVCQHPHFPMSKMSAAFHSDLGYLIEKNEIEVWAFGHTHANLDCMIAGTRIVSNQAGYPGENVAGFEANFTIEL